MIEVVRDLIHRVLAILRLAIASFEVVGTLNYKMLSDIGVFGARVMAEVVALRFAGRVVAFVWRAH